MYGSKRWPDSPFVSLSSFFQSLAVLLRLRRKSSSPLSCSSSLSVFASDSACVMEEDPAFGALSPAWRFAGRGRGRGGMLMRWRAFPKYRGNSGLNSLHELVSVVHASVTRRPVAGQTCQNLPSSSNEPKSRRIRGREKNNNRMRMISKSNRRKTSRLPAQLHQKSGPKPNNASNNKRHR